MSQNLKTSEYVTLGHPDKVADYISEYILDRMIEKDANVRYALECQIKDYHVSLAGEVSTFAPIEDTEIQNWAKEAINKIGYDSAYSKKFGKDFAICGDRVDVDLYISRQSNDIAQGVPKGWGDQGIFFGMWDGSTPAGFSKDYNLARRIGKFLYKKAKDKGSLFGIDIKTQVTYDVVEDRPVQIVIAIPTVKGKLTHTQASSLVKELVRKEFGKEVKGAKFIINGTGAYHVHGPIGDSGTTGRKLVVDFYGSGSRIGGGSPWTKDGTKADLTLNLFARELAQLAYLHWKEDMPNIARVETELCCCIGKPDVICVTTAYDNEGIPIHKISDQRKVHPDFLIQRYQLKTPRFAKMCEDGIFANGLEADFVSTR